MSDTQRVSKIQIPTNPRIASGLSFGIVKSDKENLVADTTPKPAYISVSVPKNNTKASAPEDNDAIIKVTSFYFSFQMQTLFRKKLIMHMFTIFFMMELGTC